MISEQQFDQFQTPFPLLYTEQISNTQLDAIELEERDYC